MRRMIVSVITVVGLLIGAVCLYREYGIVENALYSEEILNTNEKTKKGQDAFVTRVEALEIAYGVFGQGLGISLLDMDINMNVNLYYDKDNNGTYKWAMDWNRENTTNTYSCTIDAINGKLLDLYVMEAPEKMEVAVEKSLTKKQAMRLITPFLKAVGIDEEKYDMKIVNRMFKEEQLAYSDCMFQNKENPKDQFIIQIDENTDAIIVFQLGTGE